MTALVYNIKCTLLTKKTFEKQDVTIRNIHKK